MTEEKNEGALIAALVRAKQSFQPIAKDRTNPFHKSKYATLDSVLESVEEAMSQQGLALIQMINDREGKPYLVTRLYHTSGAFFESWYPLPNSDTVEIIQETMKEGSKETTRTSTGVDPQKFGAAVTYARRYSVCAMLSVTADEDDDGNSAKSKPREKDVEGDAKVAKVSAAMPTGMKNVEVVAIIQKKWGSSITTPRQLTHEQVDELVSLIQSQAA